MNAIAWAMLVVAATAEGRTPAVTFEPAGGGPVRAVTSTSTPGDATVRPERSEERRGGAAPSTPTPDDPAVRPERSDERSEEPSRGAASSTPTPPPSPDAPTVRPERSEERSRGSADLRLAPSSPSSASALALPGLLLAGLAVTALLLRRRKARAGLVQILETQSLGPKRALVVARLGDELLLLGSAEGGITLLRSQPAPAGLAVPAAAVAAPPPPARAAVPAALSGLVSRLRAVRGGKPAGGPAFDALLAESAEDQELRRKLARGQGGSVR